MTENTKKSEHQKGIQQYEWSKLSKIEKDFHHVLLDSSLTSGKQVQQVDSYENVVDNSQKLPDLIS